MRNSYGRGMRPRLHCLALTSLSISGMTLSVPALGQIVEFSAPSPYWCNKVDGAVVGSAARNEIMCRAQYKYQAGACDLFRQYDDADPAQRKALETVRNARVCISDTVLEAKQLSLRYRIEMMRYVTAGRDETVNDPIKGFRPKQGETGGRAAQFSAYALNQCIVETCEKK